MKPNKSITLIQAFLLLVMIMNGSCKKEESTVSSISVKTPPTKIVYFNGENLDLTGMEITITMSNEDKKEVKYADFEKENILVSPSNGTALTPSITSFKVEHTLSGKITNQAITVKEIALAEILIKNPAEKSEYVEGEILNLSGLLLTLVYNNGNKEDIAFTDMDKNGITANPKNGTTLTSLSQDVVFLHTISGKNVKQNISVNGVNGIALKTAPVKTDYYKGELLDLNGLEVVLVLANTQSVNVTFTDFSKYGITTDIQNKEELSSDKSSIQITHPISGKKALLTVYVHDVLLDIDGNSYNIVKINNKIWMKENLKVKRYADGTSIPQITDNTAWANLNDNNTDAAMCFYNNNLNKEADTYGALYTYAAAVKGTPFNETTKINIQGVCPSGWHIPSDYDWQLIFSGSGGSLHAGRDLKETGTSHWNSPNSGVTDKFGFKALPAGERVCYDGVFGRIQEMGAWWTSSESSTNYAWRYSMYFNEESTNPYNSLKGTGASVRCVKD